MVTIYISIYPDSTFYGAWIFRMDGDGDLKWQRHIADTRYPSGQFLYTGAEMSNGALVFTGSLGFPGPPEGFNVWLLRTDSTGCLSLGCGDFQGIVPVEEPPPTGKEAFFEVFPNPFHDKISLSYTSGNALASGDYLAVLYDAQGRLVTRRLVAPEGLITTFELKDGVPGMYFVVVFRNGEALQVVKVMKQ